MEQAIEFFNLANFSSFIEFTAGLNLVFSIWDNIRQDALNSFNKKAEEHKVTLQAKLGEKFEGSRCSTKFEQKITKYQNLLTFMAKFAKWLGIGVSIFLLSLLIYIGFNPQMTVTYGHCISIIIVAILPSSILIGLGHLYVAYSMHKIQSFIEQQTDAVADWETVYNSAHE